VALTPKQQRFVDEYLIDLNATQAAIRAGYAAKDADVQGPRLLGNVGVAEKIGAALRERAQRVEITQDYVLTTIVETIERCKALANFNPTGVLKGSEMLAKHLGMLKEKFEHSGVDGGPIRFEDALNALR
jgi:phage terminase small subunit